MIGFSMKRLALPCSLLLLATACGDDTKPLPSNTHDALVTYADIALAGYQDSDETADALLEDVNALAASPADPELAIVAARDAWLAARVPYLQTEAYRFASGPIDADDGNPEGLINAWPINESGIDYVVGAIPFFGNLFDFAFKANDRNLKLLERSIAAGDRERRQQSAWDWVIIGGLMLAIVAAAIGSLAVAIFLAGQLLELFR